MRRLLSPIPLIVVLLALPASASADGAGHNPATRKLEAAFTRALSERVDSSDGCFPAPPALAKTLAKREGLKTGVAAKLGSVRNEGIVYVVRKGSSCNGVRLALRDKSGLYVLDSGQGEIRVIGAERSRDLALERANRGPLRGLRLATKSFKMTQPHRRDRFDVTCPAKTYPLGGGIITAPPVGPDGEGVYPHSFERLGAQRGWHITAWLFDPSGGVKASRQITLQAMCGRGLVPETAPHRTVFTKPGQSKTVTAACPKGEVLMSGGFQRTDFLADGGNYVTESRATGPRSWRVSGKAYGDYGGELTAIAYCIRSKRPLLTEVSASTPLPAGSSATVTTPACPGNRRLTSGGFSANGSQDTFFAGGSINAAANNWTVTGWGQFGPAPSLTAYGYCLQPGR